MSEEIQARDLQKLVRLATNIRTEHRRLVMDYHEFRYDKPDLDTIEVFLDLEGMADLDFIPIDEFRIRYYRQYGAEISATFLTRHLKKLGFTKRMTLQWCFWGAKLVRPSPVLYRKHFKHGGKELFMEQARERLEALAKELTEL